MFVLLIAGNPTLLTLYRIARAPARTKTRTLAISEHFLEKSEAASHDDLGEGGQAHPGPLKGDAFVSFFSPHKFANTIHVIKKNVRLKIDMKHACSTSIKEIKFLISHFLFVLFCS